MITEDYVSFEIAKLLKEKGFDIECCSYYREANKNIKSSMSTGPANWNGNNFLLSCPTLQMAMKWLRKTHNIDIIINVSSKDESDDERKYTYVIVSKRFIGTDNVKRIYEETCEAAIKYCLENLI